MLPALALAAPVPKGPEKSDVELTLSAKNQLVLKITIQNNGKQPLELPFQETPFEHIVVDLHNESGNTHRIGSTRDDADKKSTPGKQIIPAGQSLTLSLHTCHSLPELGDRREKVTFTARLKLGSKTIISQPLTVEP
jgi:hypothetical protein